MLTTRSIKYGLPVWTKWFHKHTSIFDLFAPVHHIQNSKLSATIGLRREPFYTLIIDLSLTSDQLLSQCKDNTRYEIRRAAKEGVRIAIEHSPENFIQFFNSFAEDIGIAAVRLSYLESIGGNLCITRADSLNETLAMHAYICDRTVGRARLLHSATIVRTKAESTDSHKDHLSSVARANRFLHFSDMLHFKNLGFNSLDLGGLALDTTDPSLKNINKFKLCFGGQIIEESNFSSILLLLLRKVQVIFSKSAS